MKASRLDLFTSSVLEAERMIEGGLASPAHPDHSGVLTAAVGAEPSWSERRQQVLRRLQLTEPSEAPRNSVSSDSAKAAPAQAVAMPRGGDRTMTLQFRDPGYQYWISPASNLHFHH